MVRTIITGNQRQMGNEINKNFDTWINGKYEKGNDTTHFSDVTNRQIRDIT